VWAWLIEKFVDNRQQNWFEIRQQLSIVGLAVGSRVVIHLGTVKQAVANKKKQRPQSLELTGIRRGLASPN